MFRVKQRRQVLILGKKEDAAKGMFLSCEGTCVFFRSDQPFFSGWILPIISAAFTLMVVKLIQSYSPCVPVETCNGKVPRGNNKLF